MPDYTQPFWVGFNNPNFRGVRDDGTLPPLELPEKEDTRPIIYEVVHEHISTRDSTIFAGLVKRLSFAEEEVARLKSKAQKQHESEF